MNGNDVAARRARAAELDTTLQKLRAQYEILMNRFRFEAARDLAPLIEAAEEERALLLATLPPAPTETPAPNRPRRPRPRLPVRRRR
jgi:hypothetical protein